MLARLLTLMTLFSLLVAACDDDPVKPDQSGPLFALQITDSTDQPVAGIRVGSINHSPYLDLRRAPAQALPSTPIEFELPDSVELTLTILDYFGDTIAQPYDHEVVTGGAASLDIDFPLPGFYEAEFITPDDTTSQWLVIESHSLFSDLVLGITDPDGSFGTDDTLLFPCLLGSPPRIVITNESGEVIDTVDDFYSDTVTLLLGDTLGGTMQINQPLHSGANSIDVTWDPNY